MLVLGEEKEYVLAQLKFGSEIPGKTLFEIETKLYFFYHIMFFIAGYHQCILKGYLVH